MLCIARFPLLSIILIFFAAGPGSGVEFTVAYTGNTSGKLSACTCPGDRYGGLAERVTLVKRLRKQDKDMLLLDSGNMTALFGDFDARAACVVRLMNLMQYDAAGIGRQELFNNLPAAFRMRSAAHFPFLSASIARLGESCSAFPPYTVLRAGKARVGVVGVCDSVGAFFPDLNRKSDYRLLPFVESLWPVIDDLARRTDFIVVLAQMEPENCAALLRVFPAVDLVIVGSGDREMARPKVVGRGFLVAPGGRGQFVGMVTLEKTARGAPILKRGELIPVTGVSADPEAAAIVRAYSGNREPGR